MDADVIVVGAGVAGLTASSAIARSGRRVIIVEGRNRIGGRVFPVPLGDDGEIAELGAEFVHGRADATRALLREAGVDAIEADGDSWVRAPGGTLQREQDDFREVTSLFDGARSLDADESVERYLRRFDGDKSVREKVAQARLFVEGFDAADTAVASVRGVAEELHSGVDSGSARPATTYRPLLDLLARRSEAAGVEVRLSTAVRTVWWQRGSVRLEVDVARDKREALTAKAALITVPAGVLRHRGEGAIRFDPPMPPSKRSALKKIETGHVVKVVMAFRTPFWEFIDDGRYRDAGFFRSVDLAFPVYWTRRPAQSRLIVAWAGGPKASALLRLPLADVPPLAFDGFAAVFGEDARAGKGFKKAVGAMQDWSTDPFACGAYSYVAVGGGDARAELGAPLDGTLFFAGEATATDGQGGTVSGAIETGLRAAREVAALTT